MLGTRIAQRRVELRLSQKELANQAGISVTYLSELERNKRFPSARILCGYCQYPSRSYGLFAAGHIQGRQDIPLIRIL